MPQRYDIVTIHFQANARGANAAIESMRVATEKCQAQYEKLKADLKQKIQMNLPQDQIDKARQDLAAQKKELKQFKSAYRELIKGMRTVDEGIKAFNDGTLAKMPAEFQKKFMNAADKVRSRLNPDTKTYKQDTQELTAAIDAADQNFKRIQTDVAHVIKAIRDGHKVSRQAVEEELQAQRNLQDSLAEDDKDYQKVAKSVAVLDHYLKAMGGSYEYIRQNMSDTKKVSDETLRNTYNELQKTNNEGKVTQRIMRDNSKFMHEIRKEQTQRIENVLGGDLSKQSEGNIRQAIASAKELIQVYGTGSKKARDLSVEIVNAEEYLKTVGVEAARNARKQADEAQQAADKLQFMKDRMKDLRSLSIGALTETQKFWQEQLNGAKRGSGAYKEAQRNLKALADEQARANTQNLRDSANRLGRRDLSTLSEKELQESVAAAKQLAQSMKPSSLEFKVLIGDINRGEEALKKFGLAGQQAMQLMNDRMMSLGKLSDGALEETRKFWQAQMDGADRGSKAYQTAEANLTKIVNKQKELALAQNKVNADNLLNASTSKQGFSGMSETELRKGIDAAREYQKSLAADSTEYKNLSIAIAKADEFIKVYGVDAEKAELQEQKLKATMLDRISTQKKLNAVSTSGLAEAQKYWQAQMDGAERGTSDFIDAAAALEKVNQQMTQRRSDEAQRVLGVPDKYGDAEIRNAIKAMEELRDAQAHSSPEWDKYNNLVQKGKKYLEDWANTDAVAKYEDGMKNLATVSDAALADMKKFWDNTIANTEQGSAELQRYEDNLKKVNDVIADRRDYKNIDTADLLKSNDLGKYSETEIRKAIEAGKQLIQTYETGSQDAKDLAKEIVNAEKHLEQYGISAEKAAQREADAVKKADDERAQHNQLMEDQLKQGTDLSERALKAQESYWQRLIDDPKTASSSLQQYQANLLKVDMIQKQMVADNGNNALKFFQGDTSDASAEQIKEQTDALKKWRDTLPAQTDAATIKQIDDILVQLGQSAKGAADQVMSLRDAYKIGLQGLNGTFAGTNDQLKQAKQTLEDTLASTDKSTKRYDQLTRALQGIALEEKNVGDVSKEVQAILDQPKGRSFNELKLAVEEGRKSLNSMDRTTKDGQQAFDDLAAKIKACDLEMKHLAGESKGTESQFQKAWDRFKTYATFYVGAATMLQKIGSTVNDLMDLSDKMGEVRKTTGFTADQVGRLSDNLAKLDTRTPINDLLGLSAAAGQLGLTTQEDIQGFTQAANEMLVALPEMGQDGATEMMKIAIATGEVNKIQKQMQDGTVQGSSATAVAMEKIGSTIDRLRATTAAAAPPIADFVKRVGAVGAQSGISVDQVAALGATVDSLGMGTEMAATALSRMIPAIKNNAFDVAKAIGVTPETLRELFAAGKGMDAVLLVLQKMKDQGMDADSIEKFLGENGMTGIMKELDQQGARAGIVFAGLSQNVDVLRQNLATANEAYSQGTAIMDEYSKMNDTLAGKWARLKNQVEEFFVSDQTQSFMGGVVDILRHIINLLTGDGGLSASLRTVFLLISVGRLRIASFVVDAIGPITAGIKGIIKGIRGVKTEMSAVSWTNFGLAALAALGYIIYELVTLKSTTELANQALGKANREVQAATDRFEGYWQTIAQTNKTLQQAQRQHAILSAEVDKMRNSTDRSSASTANLSKKEGELKKSEDSVRLASVSRRDAIHEMNSIYGKYLGFILNETNYSVMAAKAHDQVTAAIRRETIAKQREAAITEIGSKYNDQTISDYGDLVTNLVEKGKLTRQQAVHAANHIQTFFDKNIKYNTKTGRLEVNRKEWDRLQKSGINPSNYSTQQLIAISAGDYLRGNFHLNENQIGDITGMYRDSALTKGGRRVQLIQTKTTGLRSNIRANYADTFVSRKNEEGKVEQVFGAASADADNDLENASRNTVKGGLAVAKAQIKILHNPKATKAQKAKANSELGNQIENMSNNIDNANDNSLRKQVDNFATSVKKDKYVDLGAVSKAQQESHKSLADKLLTNYGDNSGNTRVGGGVSSTTDKPLIPQTSDDNNPWGTPQSAASTNWRKMSADSLVDRRKQMNNFVKAIQDDSDITSVLKEDPALQNAIKKGMSSDMDTVIGWYNKQRLAIQDELHRRFLTNTGNWKDPTSKHTRDKAAKMVKDDMSYYMDELDAFFTERKKSIEDAQSDGEITEAESQRRILLNEQEWYQRRGQLQLLYSKNAKKVTKQDADVVYKILSDRTGESINMVKGTMGQTKKFISDIGEKSLPAWRRIQGELDKGSERSFSKSQAAVAKQMEAIEQIIAKERPFDGIVKNLNDNITTMGLLQPDFEKRRKALHDAMYKDDSDEIKALDAQEAKEIPNRLTFLLEEAEDAYSVTWDKLQKDMKDKGFGSWLDAILADDGHAGDRKQALIAQLHTVYDDVQEAIKKEAALVKKDVENIWNDTMRLPSGDSMKQTYEKAINALGIESDRTSRANSLINAGPQSQRVADKLAIKQMQIQLDMQTHYYNLMQKIGLQRIQNLKLQAEEYRSQGDINKAKQLELDATHAQVSLDLSRKEETQDLAKLQADIDAKAQESENRLYTHLREWGELLSNSMQSMFEASNSGLGDYYDNLAKMRLTGEGSGGGTYVVIDNSGTKNASAHYETLDGEDALKRQLEIQQQNATADAWKKVMDDINKKMNDEITDYMNQSMQKQAIDNNTTALVENTKALDQLIDAMLAGTPSDGSYTRDKNGMAMDKDGNVLYPIQPTEPEDNKPIWQQSQENQDKAMADGWAGYQEYGVQPPAPSNVVINEQGQPFDYMGNPLPPLASAGQQQTSDDGSQLPTSFWPSPEQAQQDIASAWTAFHDYGIQAQQDMQSQGLSPSPFSMLGGVITGTGGDDGTEYAPTVGSVEPDGMGGFEAVITAHKDAVTQIQQDSDAAAQTITNNLNKVQTKTKSVNKTDEDSTRSTFAKMAQAANMYGAVYQAMSNDNLSTSQKVQMIALQAVGQTAMATLDSNLFEQDANQKVQLPGILGKLLGEMSPWAAFAIYATITGMMGALMALATSKVSKSKSQISQVTGAGVSQGRLATGMLTYAEGNVNEFTDPSTLTPGKSYNVDGADGRTYHAKYMGKDAKTHITNGPEFHLVGERGKEAIIDAHTTRLLQMDDTGIWQSIQTLYNGGGLRSVRRKGGGMKAFADGNINDFGDITDIDTQDATDAAPADNTAMVAMQASLDRNNELLQRALDEGIHAKFDVYGKGGLIDSYDTGKKTVSRHGEKY